MGDDVAEDLFVLAHDTRSRDVPVIMCPVDLRDFEPPPPNPNDPAWLPDLYKKLKENLKNYPKPPDSGLQSESAKETSGGTKPEVK